MNNKTKKIKKKIEDYLNNKNKLKKITTNNSK